MIGTTLFETLPRKLDEYWQRIQPELIGLDNFFGIDLVRTVKLHVVMFINHRGGHGASNLKGPAEMEIIDDTLNWVYKPQYQMEIGLLSDAKHAANVTVFL